MASRRKKPMKLGLAEKVEFIEAAHRMHDACRRPSVNVLSDDYRALRDLNEAICDAIRRIFGKEPPWAATPVAWEEFYAQVRTMEVDRSDRFQAG